MLKNIRDGKICAKNGMKIAAHKTYLVYAAFWCSENCAAKCWKQKWHKSGAARLGSGFCAIYAVIYLRQYRIILSADTASEVPQLPERCLSRKAGIVRCCLRITTLVGAHIVRPPPYHLLLLRASRSPSPQTPAPQITTHPIKKPPFHLAVRPKMWYSILSKVLLCPNHSKYFSLFLLIRRNIHAKHSDCIRKYNLCRRK